MPTRAGQCQRGLRRAHTLSHHLHARQDVVQGTTVGQLDADVTVAAERAVAGEHEIAEPGQPGERVAAGTCGTRQP